MSALKADAKHRNGFQHCFQCGYLAQCKDIRILTEQLQLFIKAELFGIATPLAPASQSLHKADG
ncbi:hypothetical protein KL86CLO1_10817 [uncultured Eubacteriales bacterium]|uniref:Uncharacterized protein n=1 Tax=uncultured Eubacteriales bacterium TaxID=172733 RepID=A0A212JBC6_9FIRM|nr:hypothetical protein KL86CLO1_10817 [uncultured Eubacteriales bacterium]